MINPELSLVQSARQYKGFKNEVKRLTDCVCFLGILTSILSLIFLIIGIIEVALDATPLFLKLALMLFTGRSEDNPGRNIEALYYNSINWLVICISILGTV